MAHKSTVVSALLLLLVFVQSASASKKNKSSRGCFAELRCGGKSKRITRANVTPVLPIE